MNPIRIFILLIFFQNLNSSLYSQGCSDAGFCNLSSLKARESDSLKYKYTNQLIIGGTYGKADHNIKINNGYIAFLKTVDSSSDVEVRFTYISQRNSLVTSYGPSDLFILANWKIKKDFYLTTGCKVALTDANDAINGQSLPMDFQNSLGTFDIILGFAYVVSGLQLKLALQQPLDRSKNTFLAENYPYNSPYHLYQSTNHYKRNGDILLRAAYPYHLNNKLRITPSLLPVYHIENDEYKDIDGNKVSIADSRGLTLNANLSVDFVFGERNIISLSFSAPLVTRKIRPDGLTRKYLAGLEYSFRF